MTKKLILLAVIVTVWNFSAIAAAPEITAVTFTENTNILRIDFDGSVLTTADYFNIGGLTFSGSEDVTLTGGVIQNANASDNYIEICLTYTGNIGIYTITDDPETYYTWGTVYDALESLESMESHDDLVLLVRENTYLGTNYDTNAEITAGDAPDVNYTVDPELPELIYAEYDAAINHLTVIFDQNMQWDSEAEDLMFIWIDTLGIEHREPGSGIFESGEDLNDNGVLDFEQNLRFLDMSVGDGIGNITLTGGLTVNNYDNDTLELELKLDDYRLIENLNTDSLIFNFPAYTFVSALYNPAVAVAGFPVTFTPDDDPCYADSAVYDLKKNELKVFFTNTLGTGDFIVPITKFSFTIEDSTIVLEAASTTPNVSGSNATVKFELLPSQQMDVELLIAENPGSTVYVNIDNYAILDDLGNGNELSENVPCTILDDGGTNKSPEVVQANYNAETNVFEIEFDQRLIIDEQWVNLDGFALYNGGDTFTFANSGLGESESNKVVWIIVHPDDELAIEGVDETEKNNFIILLDAFSVHQNPDFNGNWAITEDDANPVAYILDTTPPLPDYVKYNSSTENIVMHFNEAMSLEVDFTKFTFAGLSFEGTEVQYGDDASWLLVELTAAEKSALDALPDDIKDAVSVDIQPGAFTSVEGLEIDLPNTTFMDGEELTAGSETIVPLVGIGRNFWLISKEAFPTLDREIPATIRKIGEHSIIYVADDQWVPYNTVDVYGYVDSTNHNYVPMVQSEIDAVYEYFEAVDSAYFKVNDIFAVGVENKIPETVNILVCDIRDEYNLGRNDSNRGYWIGSFFNPNDQSSVWEAGEDYHTNDLDMIYLDSWPQLYSDADTSWFWNTTPAVDVWDFSISEAAGGDFEVSVFNAIVNAYAKLLCYKVDPWESQWMIEGLASFAEFVVLDEVSFCGAGSPTTPTANSIRNLSNGLKTRIDYYNAYLYILYLYEKYGGLDLIETLSVQAAVDMASIDVTFEKMLQKTVNDTGAEIETLRELWASHTSRDVFSYYGAACLLDTTNMAFADLDPFVDPDNRMFQFDNADLHGVISGKNGVVFKWDEVKGAPPYYISQENWSFNIYYATFNPGAGLTNQMIAATKPFGAEVAMVDTSIINILLPFSDLNFFQFCLKNEAVATPNEPDFYFKYYPYDEDVGGVSFPVSPDAPDTNWTFYHYADDGAGDVTEEGDYKSLVMLGVLGGSGKITQEALPPAMYQVSIAQNPLVSSRFDVYLIVSDQVWGDFSSSDDVPELTYSIGESSNTLYMVPFEFTEPFGYDGSYSFFSTFLNLDAMGTYDISIFFTDLAGEEYTIGPTGFSVDNYQPGSGSVVGIGGASCYIDGAGYNQAFNLSMSKIDDNADMVEEEEFLYSSIMFQAPPAVNVPVGPSYNIGPDIVLNEPAWVTLPYGDYIGEYSPSELGAYIYRNGSWDYIGGTPDPADQTIKVRAKQLGLMQIQAGQHPSIPADLALPTKYVLNQNYPNPFNPATSISYQLPLAGKTYLKIYDITGREVVSLIDGYQYTGSYTVTWDGRSNSGTPVASGVYFYTLESGKFKRTSKMILLK